MFFRFKIFKIQIQYIYLITQKKNSRLNNLVTLVCYKKFVIYNSIFYNICLKQKIIPFFVNINSNKTLFALFTINHASYMYILKIASFKCKGALISPWVPGILTRNLIKKKTITKNPNILITPCATTSLIALRECKMLQILNFGGVQFGDTDNLKLDYFLMGSEINHQFISRFSLFFSSLVSWHNLKKTNIIKQNSFLTSFYWLRFAQFKLKKQLLTKINYWRKKKIHFWWMSKKKLKKKTQFRKVLKKNMKNLIFFRFFTKLKQIKTKINKKWNLLFNKLNKQRWYAYRQRTKTIRTVKKFYFLEKRRKFRLRSFQWIKYWNNRSVKRHYFWSSILIWNNKFSVLNIAARVKNNEVFVTSSQNFFRTRWKSFLQGTKKIFFWSLIKKLRIKQITKKTNRKRPLVCSIRKANPVFLEKMYNKWRIFRKVQSYRHNYKQTRRLIQKNYTANRFQKILKNKIIRQKTK